MKKTILASVIALALGASAQSWANPNSNTADRGGTQNNSVPTSANNGSSAASERGYVDNSARDNSDQSAGRNDNSVQDSRDQSAGRNDNSTNLTHSQNNNSDHSTNGSYNTDDSVSIGGSVVNAQLDAAVTDVDISPNNQNSASNYIQQGAFSDAAGINMAAQNTGHASNIQQNVSVQANFAGSLNLQ